MRFLDIHTHHEEQTDDTHSILSLSVNHGELDRLPDDRLLSLGLHPWFSSLEHLDADMNKLEQLASHAQVKMIGECGLDRIKGPAMTDQLQILHRQIDLGVKLQKPVILHCVRAYDELMGLKKAANPEVPLIIHGFNKHAVLGRQLLAKGFALSFGKALLNEQSGPALLVQESDDFFLETDDAEISIAEIYSATANLRKCSVEEVKDLIFANWKKIKLI